MKVLVTGTDGYIGSRLAALLIERGHDLVGLDRGYYRDGWLYNDEIHRFPPCVNRDIRHITEDDLRGFDAVVHLAELSNDPLGQHNPAVTYQINHLGTVNLAAKCIRAGISRFIYTSSCSVYGAGNGDGYKTEESEPNPQTAYAKCKVLVERDLSAMSGDRFSPTFLRNATAYGPSPRMRFDLVLNNLAGLAWTTKEIKMTSDGTPWRPLVHVLDIAHAIACALEAPRQVIHDQIFNVGATSANYQVREIAQIVAGTFPDCTLTFGKSDGDNRSYRVNFDKINATLPGFKCARDPEMGARELLELFQRIGMTHETFNFRAYTRLKQLQHLIKTRQIDEDFYWLSMKSLTDQNENDCARAPAQSSPAA
ncbi:MAG: NAD-dependent epimerase/dehydratase family protein [Candidatus Binatia bacterium]